MLRAILFDLDGTLVDSLDDIRTALDAAMADHGLAAPSRAQVRGWIGGGARRLVEQAVAPALVDPVLARFGVHYAAAPVVHTRLYPGLAPVLDQLARTRVLAVLTNKPQELAVKIAGALLAPWPFAAIVGGRAGTPLKPDPAAAVGVAHALGVPANACALVGDAPTDVETARAAGMRPVAVTWGYRPRAALAAAAPALVIDEPAGLLVLG